MGIASGKSGVAVKFMRVSYETLGGKRLLSDVSFSVGHGETVVMLGRSGAGKTTALKLINALLQPTAGEVHVAEQSTREWDPIQLRRSIGYAIQEVGLLPHLSVAKNIGLVPRLNGWQPDRIQKRVDELMQMVGLRPEEFRNRYPHQLSGGQRQRVGLARALAADPPILLMDEPFGALDPLTRADIQQEFQRLQERLKKSVVFVTHDVREALLLGDRIAVMEGGRLLGMYSSAEFLSSREPLVSAYVASIRSADVSRASGDRRWAC
jgi:osmoprotectant transport system ATP-binding protein